MSRRTLLASAVASAVSGCGVVLPRGTGATSDTLSPLDADAAISFRRAGSSISRELQWARTAWRYVENNTDEKTGLVNGVDRSVVFTAWNLADAIAATVAARELRIIEAREFDLRMSRLLGFAATMELSGGVLPNKAYNAFTGKMVNFGNQPEDIGWSAVDTGRLMLWLKIVAQRHPQFAEYADKVVLRFAFCDVIDDCGRLFGSSRSGGQTQKYAEGRLGYEQLAGAGFAAWGFDAARSTSLPATEVFNIYGMPVRHDARDPRTTGAQAPLLTMPFVLMGVELGWQQPGGAALKPLAETLFKVQEERWRREKVLTARSDYQTPDQPYVVLDSVYASGYPFNTIASDGRHFERLALVNTRAAFGMWALWGGEYGDRLIDGVKFLYDPDRGWYEGRFETGAPHPFLTLSTNAAILEALLFKATGAPLWKPVQADGPFRVQSSDPYAKLNKCWPKERVSCRA
nr:DUF3131 domain-containing protein [Ramlibacter albus]